MYVGDDNAHGPLHLPGVYFLFSVEFVVVNVPYKTAEVLGP